MAKGKEPKKKAAEEDPLYTYKNQIKLLIQPAQFVGGFLGDYKVVDNDECYKLLIKFSKKLEQEQMHEVLGKHLCTPAIYNFITWVITEKSKLFNHQDNTLIEKLITKESIKYKDGDNWTHLHFAVQSRNKSITEALLKLNADPDVKTKQMAYNCLKLAKQYKNDDLKTFTEIKELLDEAQLVGHQADPDHDGAEAQ